MGVKRLIQVGFLSAILFLGVTYPLIFHFTTSVFTDPNWSFDTLGTLYGIWWFQYAWEQGVSWGNNFLLAHPFGLDWSHLPVQPLLTYPLLLFSLIKGDIFAYNFYILFNYVLTGVFTYAFCFYFTRHERGSLLGALVFTFAPNHLLQTMSHLGFSSTQWIPLFLLSWLYFWDKRTWRAVFFCAISVALLFWANYYFFYFSLFFCVVHLLFTVGAGKLNLNLKTCVRFICLLGMSGLLLSPQLVPLIKNTFQKNPSAEVAASGYARSEKDLYKYAARPSDYLLPSEYHPVFSGVTEWVQERFTRKRHFSDRTLYLGFFPLMLILTLFFYWRRLEERDRYFVLLFAVSGIFFVWFSFAPWWKIGGMSVPSPSAVLHHVFPMFRYYSRAGFLVSLFVAVLLAYSWKYIPIKFSSNRTRQWVCVLAAAVILFEFSVVPPFRNLSFAQTPKVYEWLKTQPGDFAIIEYPYVRSIKERQQKYMFYQRLHQKRLVNGGDEGTLSDMLRKKAQNIQNPGLWALLKHFNTQYVLVHQGAEGFDSVPYLKKAQQFESCTVYEIDVAEQDMYFILINFGQPLRDHDGGLWQWIGQTARVWLLNTTEQSQRVTIAFDVFSPEQNRLSLYLNQKQLQTISIGKNQSQTVLMKEVRLKPGENVLAFKPDKRVAHPNDSQRRVSFQISGFQLNGE